VDAEQLRARVGEQGMLAPGVPLLAMFSGGRDSTCLLDVAVALLGAEVLFYPTAIGSEPYDIELDTSRMWRRAMIGHAVSNCMPVVAANRIGTEQVAGAAGPQKFYGHSFIADEWGDLVADYGAGETGVLVARLDLGRAATHRAGMGFFRDRRPQLYARLAEDV